MSSKNNRFTVIQPIIIALSIVAGILISNKLNDRKSPFSSGRSSMDSGSKLDLILQYIENEYVDSVDVNAIIEKVIPEVLEELDPHSSYISSEEFQDMNDPLEGEFEGIGVQFNIQKDTTIIVQVISGGPSEKVSIKPGDRIIKVNDSLIAGNGITSKNIVRLLKGPKGTKVKVGIKRNGEKNLIDFVITRDKIPFYSIEASYMPRPEIGYVKISRFAMTTYDEFRKHCDRLRGEGMKKLIIDLRGNGGGYLNASTNIANELLEKGEMIVYTEGKATPKREYLSDKNGAYRNLELVLLVDELSASASEILAGAIQDNDRGTLIGRRTFGKGLVMDQRQFNDMSALRLTIARYYTPSGRCIQKPYGEGNDAYYHEIDERYDHGEFTEKDSIEFVDTLKYKTKGGRTVYGGGGIMPDVFIPLDTTGYSEYLSKITNLGLLYEFCFGYADNNREALSKLSTPEMFQKFVEKNNILDAFIAFAKKAGIEPNNAQIKHSKKVIENRLSAYIARNIIDDKGFYPIFLQIDNAFLKAIEVLESEAELSRSGA